MEPCYNNSVESWRCESTASTAALDDAHDFLRAQQRSAIRAERSLVFYLPRYAAFKLLSRVRLEPRPKPQALSLPSKRRITASWRQQGQESSGKMVKAGKRRAKRYSLRPPPARSEEGASFFRMRGKKNQALRYVLEPKRHENGAKWQEAPTENGGQVVECRPAPGRPGGATATTAEPKAEAASPRGRQTKNSHRFPAVVRDSDRPGRAGDGRPRKRTWPDTQRRNLAGAPTNAARIKQPTENRRRAEPRKGSAARQRRKAHFACIVQQAERPPARRVTLVRDPLHAPHLKTA